VNTVYIGVIDNSGNGSYAMAEKSITVRLGGPRLDAVDYLASEFAGAGLPLTRPEVVRVALAELVSQVSEARKVLPELANRNIKRKLAGEI